MHHKVFLGSLLVFFLMTITGGPWWVALIVLLGFMWIDDGDPIVEYGVVENGEALFREHFDTITGYTPPELRPPLTKEEPMPIFKEPKDLKRPWTDMSFDTEVEMFMAFVILPLLLFVVGAFAYTAFN